MCIRDSNYAEGKKHLDVAVTCFELANDQVGIAKTYGNLGTCLLYTSDAADERSSVDLGGRRIIKKKKTQNQRRSMYLSSNQ